MDALLEISHLSKEIKGFRLEDIDFCLESGYIMGLVGLGGAGKTTLINILLGLYKMDSGYVKIGGYDLVTQTKKAKDLVGFVLEKNPFQEELSAISNAKLYGGFYSNWSQEIFEKYLKIFEVNGNKPLKKLSKGTILKFQLAFALSHEARLFIMDEPVAGLDPVFRRELRDIMSELIYDGSKSIIFSTNVIDEFEKIMDYYTLLMDGKQIFSKNKEDILEEFKLIKGSGNQINAIPKKMVVGMKHLDNISYALVNTNEELPKIKYEVTIPSIEDILFYLTNKGL